MIRRARWAGSPRWPKRPDLDAPRPCHCAGGILDRVLSEDGPLARLLSDGGAADRLLAPGGPLDRLLAPSTGCSPLPASSTVCSWRTVHSNASWLEDRGFVEKLVTDGGTLDQLVALGPILEQVHPRLLDLVGTLPELRASIGVLGESVGPLAELANRIPGRRKPAS